MKESYDNQLVGILKNQPRVDLFLERTVEISRLQLKVLLLWKTPNSSLNSGWDRSSTDVVFIWFLIRIIPSRLRHSFFLFGLLAYVWLVSMFPLGNIPYQFFHVGQTTRVNLTSKQDSPNSRPKFFKATVSRFLCFDHKGHVAGMPGLGQIPIHLIQLLWRRNEHLPSGWSILSRKVFLT